MSNGKILKDLIDSLGSNVSAFEKKIGVAPTRIDKLIKRDSRISLDIVQQIKAAYPQVNRQWLQTGEGDMFLSDEQLQKILLDGAASQPKSRELSESIAAYQAIEKLAASMEKLVETRKVDSDSMNKLAESRLKDSDTMSRLVAMLEMKLGTNPQMNAMALHPATSAGGIWGDAMENASKKEASKG